MSSTGYSVTSETLTKEAADWSHEAERLRGVITFVEGLKTDRANSGIFELIMTGNNQVADSVAMRSFEGCEEMHRIADALRLTAQNYTDNELESSAAFKSLQH